MKFDREKLKEKLRSGECTVTFTKTDGSERVMKCTLQESYFKPTEKKTDRIKKDNDEVIAVWDIDVAAWRSFRIDSITSVQ